MKDDGRPLRPRMMFFSDHALDQMEVRRITREEVKRILYTGDLSQSNYQPLKGLYRNARKLKVRGRWAEVIYTIKPQRYDIITVYWVTK